MRDAFLDEGVDEQVLQEMKQIWRTKLMASKAVEINHEPPELQPPQIVVNNPKVSKVCYRFLQTANHLFFPYLMLTLSSFVVRF